MGTTWQVTYLPVAGAPERTAVEQLIVAQLDAVNESMSTYREDSEISRFSTAPVGVPLSVSQGFLEVLQAALAVGERSQGAYDVTLAPLVELWGFGPAEPLDEPPAHQRIVDVLAQTGQAALQVDRSALTVTKLAPRSLDFSSLAKGYAVDRVALALEAAGIGRYLVEVGGEMRVAGLSHRDDLWRVAIEQPDAASRSVARTIELTDAAIATSGDYRNFVEFNGQRYSHSIDPRTGYPVLHDLVSVTVVHPSAMLADAWATALLVLGAQEAGQVARRHHLAAYFIRRQGEALQHTFTEDFSRYIGENGHRQAGDAL
ncbi:MAG: FAD:protein FMN transferase [Gammaproteobacteria bacterium]|nr:FAD:protein FMN transferase [Gammaproteobacteria bacterium]